MKNLTDEELVKRYLKGDESAFEDLVRRHLPAVLGLARRFTGSRDKAEDITQETFLKVWRHLKKFDGRKKFKPWLFAIAKNTAFDWLGKKEAVSLSALEKNDNDVWENLMDQSALITEPKLSLRPISDLINALPDRYHKVIELRHQKDFSFREIAEALKEPLNTVKSRYRRGIALLRKNSDVITA